MNITLTFHFDTDGAATLAVDALAKSFDYQPDSGDKLEFTKAKIAALLKDRIVQQVQMEAAISATQQASSAAAAALAGTAVS